MTAWLDPNIGHPCYGSDEAFHHTPGDPTTCQDCGSPVPDEFPLAELDNEPPVGSVVVANGCAPWLRNSDGAWNTHGDEFSAFAWRDVWTSDLRVLRWGWGS